MGSGRVIVSVKTYARSNKYSNKRNKELQLNNVRVIVAIYSVDIVLYLLMTYEIEAGR